MCLDSDAVHDIVSKLSPFDSPGSPCFCRLYILSLDLFKVSLVDYQKA